MTGKREKTAALSKGRQQGGLQKAALYFWKHKYLYLMLLPAILYYIIFCYVPMYGVTIAFKDFNPMLGIWKSPWAGTEMFQKLFGMEKFYSVFWNTIRISLIRLIFGFPFPIIIALLLNELRLGKVKRVIQTAIYIPNFISWVVLGGILTSLLSMDSGIVNGVIKALGFAPIGFLTDEKYFVGTMVVSMIWKRSAGTRLSIWRRSPESICSCTRRRPWTGRTGGRSCYISHCRVSVLLLSLC